MQNGWWFFNDIIGGDLSSDEGRRGKNQNIK